MGIWRPCHVSRYPELARKILYCGMHSCRVLTVKTGRCNHRVIDFCLICSHKEGGVLVTDIPCNLQCFGHRCKVCNFWQVVASLASRLCLIRTWWMQAGKHALLPPDLQPNGERPEVVPLECACCMAHRLHRLHTKAIYYNLRTVVFPKKRGGLPSQRAGRKKLS